MESESIPDRPAADRGSVDPLAEFSSWFALAAEGAELVLCARRADRLQALADEIGGARVVPLDVRDPDAQRAAFEGEAFDFVLANAGLGRGLGRIPEGSPADWAEMMDTNVLGVLHTVHATLPAMLKRKSGDFVILGSVAGREVYPGGNVYCASKHAVRAIYTALRRDHYGSGVRFTTVDPGMVKTDFSLVRFHGNAEAAAKVYEGVATLTPEDVADAILYAVTRPADSFMRAAIFSVRRHLMV